MEEKQNLDGYYKKVTESLKLLALPYNVQKTYLPDFTDKPFEILDSYIKAFGLLPQLIENNYFSLNQVAALLRLYNFVDLILADAEFDTLQEEHINENPSWLKIRELAIDTLSMMKIIPENPDREYF